MAKERYEVVIEVCRSYRIGIQAESLADAGDKASKMNVKDAEAGEADDFEINIFGVEKSKRMMYQ